MRSCLSVEGAYRRLPLLPNEWRRLTDALYDGDYSCPDADYLLIDLGIMEGRPRHTIVGLNNGVCSLRFCETIAELLSGNLGIESSLVVPMEGGQIGLFYCTARSFDRGDIDRLQHLGSRMLDLLDAFSSGRIGSSVHNDDRESSGSHPSA